MGGAVWMNAGTKWGSYSDVIQSVRFVHPEKGIFEKNLSELGLKYRGHGEGLMDHETAILSVDIKLLKNKSPADSRKLVDEILAYRGARQPLEFPNCGSVFKNPQNSEKGSGRLIEAAELKGKQIGQAMISPKHANFILNLGAAKSSDVEALIRLCQEKVLEKFKISLEPEVIILGQA
jgi:UDP-N-acetylmuramate dehydrogenase